MMRHFSLIAGACLLTALSLSPARGDVLSLDGIDDWVELIGTNFPTGDDSFTIGAWINPTSIPTGGENGGQITFWGTQGPVNAANGFRLKGDSAVRHYFWGNDQDAVLPGGSVLPDTTGPNGDGWNQLTVTYDGSETAVYLNGALLGTRAVSGVNVADANYRIGSRIGAEFFDGFIDEVSVWNVPLDAATIAAGFMLELDPSAPEISPFLVAYYNFEDGLRDSAGGDNDGTAMGGAVVIDGMNAPVVPEPTSAVLCLLGLTGLLARRRRSGRC